MQSKYKLPQMLTKMFYQTKHQNPFPFAATCENLTHACNFRCFGRCLSHCPIILYLQKHTCNLFLSLCISISLYIIYYAYTYTGIYACVWCELFPVCRKLCGLFISYTKLWQATYFIMGTANQLPLYWKSCMVSHVPVYVCVNMYLVVACYAPRVCKLKGWLVLHTFGRLNKSW